MTNQTFSQLDLSPELLEAVTEMGFTEATDIQAESIPLIRTGADILARSQTGTGKTVAFGIHAVERSWRMPRMYRFWRRSFSNFLSTESLSM